MQTHKIKIFSNQSCFTAKKREVGVVAKQEHASVTHDIEHTCKANGTQYLC